MIVQHTTSDGRKTIRAVPDGAEGVRSSSDHGIVIGPPDLDELNLPPEVATRLHNELFHRGIIRRKDARFHRAEVHAALMAALRVDADRIIQIYEEHGNG